MIEKIVVGGYSILGFSVDYFWLFYGKCYIVDVIF